MFIKYTLSLQLTSDWWRVCSERASARPAHRVASPGRPAPGVTRRWTR